MVAAREQHLTPLLRDWSVSHAIDDSPGASPEQSQKSWNWHSVFGGVDALPALYPLQVTSLSPTQSTYTGSVVPGGASHYAFVVPASDTATLTLSGQSGAASGNLQLVIVRTK